MTIRLISRKSNLKLDRVNEVKIIVDPNIRQHDYDSNNQLDGIELIQAMTHYKRMDIEDRGGNDENYPRFRSSNF